MQFHNVESTCSRVDDNSSVEISRWPIVRLPPESHLLQPALPHHRGTNTSVHTLSPTGSREERIEAVTYLRKRDILGGLLTLTGLNRCSVSVSLLAPLSCNTKSMTAQQKKNHSWSMIDINIWKGTPMSSLLQLIDSQRHCWKHSRYRGIVCFPGQGVQLLTRLNDIGAIISKSVRNWRPQMPKTNFNKVLTLWTCQTYMENMSTALKPDEISFGELLLRQKLRQFRTFLKLLPIGIDVATLKCWSFLYWLIADKAILTDKWS